MAVSVRTIVWNSVSIVVCGFLPLLALYWLFSSVTSEGTQLVDFHFAYYRAAEAILAGEDIYPIHGFIVRGEQELVVDYVYPPLIAIATIPWTLLPVGFAEIVFAATLAFAVVVTLAVLGVRDWRCYGLAFLWPPVTDAVRTGNITILLGLAAALVWRFRDRSVVCGTSLGISIATKVFLWPVTMWLAATRRIAAAAWSLVVGAAALLVAWSAIGFRGIVEYPDLLRRLGDRLDERSYTVYALGVDIGLTPSVARVLWLAVAASTLVAMVVVARKGDERRAFILALTAAIACSPIVWLHYFALLLVVVAIAQPRLGPLWFIGIPMQVFVTTAVYNGSTFQTTAMLVAAAVTVLLALSWSATRRTRLTLTAPAASRP
jgi:alpha-1,2-mannosyltransferase